MITLKQTSTGTTGARRTAGYLMPSYDYHCDACGLDAVATHNIDYTGGYKCTHCSAPMRKIISAPAIHFKGGGWGGSHPGKSYKTTFHSDAATGELGSVTTEETGPAVKKGTTAQD
jgi:putative FmdB family regulatory protein